jgi:hypothetical protein
MATVSLPDFPPNVLVTSGGKILGEIRGPVTLTLATPRPTVTPWYRRAAQRAFECVFGSQNCAAIIERRPLHTLLCRVCRKGVHDVGEQCPEQWIGDCSTCGQTVELDYYRQCSQSGDRWRLHAISNMRPKPRRQLRAVKYAEGGRR